MVRSIIPPDYVYGKIADGDGYLVNSLQTVPASDSVNIHIKNPHSDKIMLIVGVDLLATGNQEFYLHDDFNSISAGTEIELQNALMDSEGGAPDSGPFAAYEGSTYDSNLAYPIGFTATDRKSIATGDISAEMMEPGREAVVEFRNQDNAENKCFFGALLMSSY